MEVKKPADPEYKWSLIYPLLWEKVPLFVLAILSSIVTYIAQQKAGAIHSEEFPLSVRIGNALVSYIAYIGKMIWPSNLAVLYPHPVFVATLAGFGIGIPSYRYNLSSYLESKEISLFGNGLAVVYRYACACHRYSAGRLSGHGGPIHLYPPDRVIHHGGMGCS